MKAQIVYCSITTWADCPSVLGEHYYARLRSRVCDESSQVCDEIDLDYVIREADAAELNEPDIFGTFAEYKPGDRSTRFFDVKKLRLAAARQYKKLFPGASLLVVGSHYTAQPQEILNGPTGLRAPANVIFRKCEKLDWWEAGNDDEVEVLMRKWLALVVGHGIWPWWHPSSPRKRAKS